MITKLVIIGAGGFGRETIDVVRAMNQSRATPMFDLLGVVDSSPSEKNLSRLKALRVPYLGTEVAWESSVVDTEVQYVVSIGSPTVRKRIAERLTEKGLRAAVLIHPAATLGSNIEISDGVIICAGAVISTNVKVGLHSHLNPSSVVGHDAILKAFVSINPAATVSGEVVLEAGCLLGAASTVLQGLTIGEASVVGAGAVVVKNVPKNVTVKGVPAR